MINNIVQVLIIVLSPLIGIYILKSFRIEKNISPVVFSYLVGIVLANSNLFLVNQEISTLFSHVTILFAIPLLLYATDLLGWWKYAKNTILSFSLCVLSGMFVSIMVALLCQGQHEESWQISGMLVGVYTGGTPNMQAIGIALKADENLFVLLNAADIFCGGIFLLMLTSFLPGLLAKWLPAFPKDEYQIIQEEERKNLISFKEIGIAIVLTLLIIGASVGITYLFSGNLENAALIILLLTTFSVAASMNTTIRNLSGAYESGEYLLLMFCVAVGLLSDFKLLLSQGGSIIFYMACVLTGTVLLHFLLARLFRIDRDTALITSTAALYGPVFIGQIASVIDNRTLVFSGVATGLVGMALGNYLGIGVAYFIQWCMSI